MNKRALRLTVSDNRPAKQFGHVVHLVSDLFEAGKACLQTWTERRRIGLRKQSFDRYGRMVVLVKDQLQLGQLNYQFVIKVCLISFVPPDGSSHVERYVYGYIKRYSRLVFSRFSSVQAQNSACARGSSCSLDKPGELRPYYQAVSSSLSLRFFNAVDVAVPGVLDCAIANYPSTDRSQPVCDRRVLRCTIDKSWVSKNGPTSKDSNSKDEHHRPCEFRRSHVDVLLRKHLAFPSVLSPSGVKVWMSVPVEMFS